MKNAVPNQEGAATPWTAFSHSGKERNRLFLNQSGTHFSNVSGMSGADSIFDGRSFVHWDFNRDGQPDLAVVNANGPLLQIFENQNRSENQFIAFRLEGDSKNGKSSGNSSRDAIGTKITLHAGKQTLMRVLSCGEGFASQNSRTILVGLGKHKKIKSVTIDWPSGASHVLKDLEANFLVKLKESEEAAETENYDLDLNVGN